MLWSLFGKGAMKLTPKKRCCCRKRSPLPPPSAQHFAMRLRQKAQTRAAARTVPDHRGHRQAVERGDLHVVGGIVAVLVKDAIDVAKHVDAAGVSVHHDPLASAVQNFTHILEEIQHGTSQEQLTILACMEELKRRIPVDSCLLLPPSVCTAFSASLSKCPIFSSNTRS